MRGLGFTLDELVEVVRTCELIAFGTCTLPYLREFIAQRLDEGWPELAAKIRRLDADQMERLCAYIQDTYAIIRR